MEAQAVPGLVTRPPGRGLPPGLSRVSDERLARMVASGSDRAFVTLYDRHAQPLYRYCRSIVGNDADAQDALQSALAAALVALRRSARDAPLRPWLFRIVHNEAISLIRRRRPTVELSEAGHPAGPSAAEQALDRARLELLVRDLRELGDRQRGALVMRELSGLSHEEIALALGVSVGAAKQAIFEARQALLELAEGHAMSCEEMRRIISDGDRRVLRARRVRGHLRDCADCAAFAEAIPARRADLNALAPPLAPLALAGVLGQLVGAGSSHGGAGAGLLAAGASGKSASTLLAAKALVGVALVTTATVGVTEVVRPADHKRPSVRQTSTPGGAAAQGAGRSAGGEGAARGVGTSVRPGSSGAPQAASHGQRGRGAHANNGKHGQATKGVGKHAGRERAHGKPAARHTATKRRSGTREGSSLAGAHRSGATRSDRATGGTRRAGTLESSGASDSRPLKARRKGLAPIGEQPLAPAPEPASEGLAAPARGK
jgi:RNA polymerase sigma factor (sigma-70 family)